MFTPSLKTSLAVSLLWWLNLDSLSTAKDYRAVAEASVTPYLAEHPYAAVTVGIIDAEGTHVFGFGKLKSDDPKSQPDGKTIYQFGSITKVFTTTMLAEQVLLGHMKLEDPAQKYLPRELVLPKEKEREITLEELATHHSGLPGVPQLSFGFLLGGSIAKNPYAGLGVHELSRLLPMTWLSSPIGESYNYSNVGIGLLGHAIVEVTKSANYAELVEQRINKPLGLSDTGLELDEEQIKRLAQGYDILSRKTPAWTFASLEGCGALYSTVDDLLFFAAANLGLRKTTLSAAMELAQRPRPKYSWTAGEMGLGWHEYKYHEIPIIWHNGATSGYTSMLALLPTKKMGIVMLSNSGNSIDPYTYVLIDLLFPQPTQPAAE